MADEQYKISSRKSALDSRDRIVTVTKKGSPLRGTPDETRTYRTHETSGILDPNQKTIHVTREKTMEDLIIGTPEENEAERRRKDAWRAQEEARAAIERNRRDEEAATEADRLAREGERIAYETSPHGIWRDSQEMRDTVNSVEYRRKAASFDYASVSLEEKKHFLTFAGRYLMAESKGYSCARRPLRIEKDKEGNQQLICGEPFWALDKCYSESERSNEYINSDHFTALDKDGNLWKADLSFRHGSRYNTEFHVLVRSEWTPIHVTEENANYAVIRLDLLLEKQKAPFTFSSWLRMSESDSETILRNANDHWSESNLRDRKNEEDMAKKWENQQKIRRLHLISKIVCFLFLALSVWIVLLAKSNAAPKTLYILPEVIGAALYGFGYYYELEWHCFPYYMLIFIVIILALVSCPFVWLVIAAMLGFGLPKLTTVLYEHLRTKYKMRYKGSRYINL